MTKVLIVDDHPLMRKGLMMSLDSEPDIQICGQASNAEEALSIAEVEEPDTAIQDQSFPSRHLTARFEMQRPESFSINEAHLWVSDQSPFGLARWEVTVTFNNK